LFVMLRHKGMHQSAGNRLRRARLAEMAVLSVAFASVASLTGCGVQYRPVVSAIGPVGPAGQPTKYAVAISSPSTTSPGLVTVVDFSGDTVLSTPQIQSNPSYFQLNPNGTQGFTINTDGSLDSIPLSSPSTLLTSNVTETTLPTASAPVSITALTPAGGVSSSTATIFIPQAATNSIAALNAGTAALYDTVGIQGGGSNPVYVVGATGTPRVYAISQNTPGGNGQVDSLETVSTASISDSAQIPVGIAPIYGVMTADDRRAFILNEGSGTVSVLNVPSNALDTLPPGSVPTGTPVGTIPLCTTSSPAASSPCPGLNPVWADLNTVSTQLVVLNQGANGNPGSLSIINIPLCNPSAQANNPNCSSTNPVDAAGFGQILATVPVGVNPSMVSVLQGTDTNAPAAYVINQGNSADTTGPCGGQGSVTVVNLQTDQVTTTICGVSGNNATAAANGSSNVIFGHPNSVSATGGAPTGKVYVTSSDNQYLSVIYTDTNTVQTHIPLQGMGLRVLVTAP
jgi:YVTN family beta-propeller protein